MPTKRTPKLVSFQRPEVAEAFAALPSGPRQRLLQLRSLIFATAAVLFAVDEPLPESALRDCIELALTYHRRK